MRAYVLSGGRGTRIRPVLGDLPKILAPIGDRPFLELQLEWLHALGIEEVVLALGVGADQVRAYLEEHHPGSRRVRWVSEPEPLGTGGAIRFAAGPEREAFFVCNGDTLADLDLDALLSIHRERRPIATVACYRVADASAKGRVEMDDRGRFVRFAEKSGGGEAWISGGIYWMEPRILEHIPGSGESSLERDVFPALLRDGETILAYRSGGRLFDIGTREGLEETARSWQPASHGRDE